MKIAEIVYNKRKELFESQEKFGERFGARFYNVSDWETGRTNPPEKVLEWLISQGTERSDIELLDKPLSLINKNSWEGTFDKRFTLAYMPGKAEGYNGDDWKIVDGEPIKPSVIKEFFKEIIEAMT